MSNNLMTNMHKMSIRYAFLAHVHVAPIYQMSMTN